MLSGRAYILSPAEKLTLEVKTFSGGTVSQLSQVGFSMKGFREIKKLF